VVAVNDDWMNNGNASQLQAAGFAPSHPLEAAVMMTLPPGAYTAIMTGVNGGTGVGLVNVRRQLKARYGGAARLALESREPRGASASLVIPLPAEAAGASLPAATALPEGARA